MKRLLFLTKNILVEKETQNKLQQLNYEVYCSSDFLTSLSSNEDISGLVSYFHLVLLSVTFSDEEIQELLIRLNSFSIPIIRESELIPSEEEYQKWRDLGVLSWIQKSDCSEVIREKIAKTIQSDYLLLKSTKSLFRIGFEKPVRTSKTNRFSISLSKFERRILTELKSAETAVVSRTVLCALLWVEGETSSHLSQLSMHIKKIREKFREAGYHGDTILTDWGKGYRLSDSFHEFLNQVEESKQQDTIESDTGQDTDIAEISSVISF